MELLHTDTLEEAREKLRQETRGFSLRTKRVNSREALFRVVAEDIISEENIPPFRRSTVDGFAVRAVDTYGAGESAPAFFKITGQVNIGQVTDIVLGAGEAVSVQTGSMIPEGATAVLMAEYCERYGADKMAAYRAVSEAENIIRAGEDIMAGECLIPCGKRLNAADMGILASLGIREVTVYEPLALTVISTGDELVSRDQEPTEGQVRDINSYALEAKAVEHGMCVKRRLCLGDDEEILFQAVSEATRDSDVVILSGGSSKGERDYTKAVLERVTHHVFTHGISIKPGKPTMLSYDKIHKTVIAGLPGHPMAAVLMFELLVTDWYRQLAGIRKPLPRYARISENVSSNQGRETCLPVRLVPMEADFLAVPVYAKSGSISCLVRADGYTLIDRNREGLKKGERIQVEAL